MVRCTGRFSSPATGYFVFRRHELGQAAGWSAGWSGHRKNLSFVKCSCRVCGVVLRPLLTMEGEHGRRRPRSPMACVAGRASRVGAGARQRRVCLRWVASGLVPVESPDKPAERVVGRGVDPQVVLFAC